jgi:hypothetical protein
MGSQECRKREAAHKSQLSRVMPLFDNEAV